MKSNPELKSNSSNIAEIIGVYTHLYKNKFGATPKINGAWCGKLIKTHLKEHSVKGIIRIIELYFEDPSNSNRVYHLPNILSGWNFNRYLPKLLYDPNLYSNAKEMNEGLY